MDIKKTQDSFFLALEKIQDDTVFKCLNDYLNNSITPSNMKMLYDISAETIYRIMELIDGYYDDKVQVDLIDKKTKESLRTGIELHDKCVDYLKSE